VMAESLSLALAETMTLEDAQALVKRAAADARGSREPLATAVKRAVDARGAGGAIDWDRFTNPAAHVGAAGEIIDRVLADARRTIR